MYIPTEVRLGSEEGIFVIWVYFWGIVTGVGVVTFGALFGIGMYLALREGLEKQLNEGKQEEE